MKQAIQRALTRRVFIRTTSVAAGGILFGCSTPKPQAIAKKAGKPDSKSLAALPTGSLPAPLVTPHFPDRLHAFVWRNWTLVPIERMASVAGATRTDIMQLGRSMGLSAPPNLAPNQQRRSYISIIKRNWHLLPYEQLLELLDWTPEQLAYTLREDDFLFTKLGNAKPRCEPLRYQTPTESAVARQREMTTILQQEFPAGVDQVSEPPFSFVAELSKKPAPALIRPALQTAPTSSSLRLCYSYFALYGDPLLETEIDPYPDGYLARLAEVGVNGVWLQAVLAKLALFPWEPSLSIRFEDRLKNLAALVARARRYGIAVYLYLNEPRAMPLKFFEGRPELQGFVEGDYAVLCTSQPAVQKYLTESIASICRAVPNLGGFFTITASENLTNCWSHNGGAKCPRCSNRSPAEVIAEVNTLFAEGIRSGSTVGPSRALIDRTSKVAGDSANQSNRKVAPMLIAWDWGWSDNWAEEVISRLPPEAALMSVSEWGLPIQRGGVQSTVGEYSLSAIGPGPRAKRHWELARRRGLKTIAKIQAGNSWELSAVPYIPAVKNVVQHAGNLSEAGVDGIMLGWTLGGYPSPNLEVVAGVEKAQTTANNRSSSSLQPEGRSERDSEAAKMEALELVAARRFGKTLAPSIISAWTDFSAAFAEFPFHIGLVYSAPLQLGPANLFWAQPTGYHASMVGFPYDDLDSWRAIYPPEVFITQLDKVASGFEVTVGKLKSLAAPPAPPLKSTERRALEDEINVADAAAIHFRSTANQARFVLARRTLLAARSATEAAPQFDTLEAVLREEIALSRRLHTIQSRDSRIGFEATNHYYYVSVDLGEKVLNCRDLLDRWLPLQRANYGRNASTGRGQASG